MGTIADKLTYLADTKSEIADAIEEKGQSVSDSDTFRSYADKIRAIQTGVVEELTVTANGTYTADPGKGYSPVNVNVGGIDVTDVSALAKRMIRAKQSVKLSVSAELYQDTIQSFFSDDASQTISTSNYSGMAAWDRARRIGYSNNTYPTSIYGAQNRYNSSPMALSKEGKLLWITINKNVTNLTRSGNSFSLSKECKTIIYDLESGETVKEIPGTCIIAVYDSGLILLANVEAVPWLTRQLSTITSGNTGTMYGVAISYMNNINLSPYHALYDMESGNLVKDFGNGYYTGYSNWFASADTLVTYPDMGYYPLIDSQPWYANGFNQIYVHDTFDSGIISTEIGYSCNCDNVPNRFYGVGDVLPFARYLVYVQSAETFAYQYSSGSDSDKIFRNLWTTNYDFSDSYNFFMLPDQSDEPHIYIDSVNIVINHNAGDGILRNKNISVSITLKDVGSTWFDHPAVTINIDCSEGTLYDDVVINKGYKDVYACDGDVLYVLFCERLVYDGSGNKIGELPCSVGKFSITQSGFDRYSFQFEGFTFINSNEVMLAREIGAVHDIHTVLVPGYYILFTDEYGDFMIYDLQSGETYSINFLTYIKGKSLFPSPFTKAVRLSRNSNTANKSCDYVVASSKYIVAMVELERPDAGLPSRSTYGLGIYKMEVTKNYVMEPALIGYSVSGANAGESCSGKLLPESAPSSIVP